MKRTDTARGALCVTGSAVAGPERPGGRNAFTGGLISAAEGSESIIGLRAGSPGRRVAGSPGRRVAQPVSALAR